MLVVVVLVTIALNGINFFYCFFKDIYRSLRLLYYKLKYCSNRVLKKSGVAKIMPFIKEEEKKPIQHPADVKCITDSNQYFVSTLDTVVGTDLHLKLKKKKVVKIQKELKEFEPDVSDMVGRLPKPLEIKAPPKPPIPEKPEDLELRLAAGLYLKPKSIKFWNQSRGVNENEERDLL